MNYLEIIKDCEIKYATVDFTYTRWVNETSSYDRYKYGEYQHTSYSSNQVERTDTNSFSFGYIEFNGYFIINENSLFKTGLFESYEEMVSHLKDGGCEEAKRDFDRNSFLKEKEFSQKLEQYIKKAITYPINTDTVVNFVETETLVPHICREGYELGIATLMVNPNKGAWMSIYYLDSNGDLQELIQSCTSRGKISQYSISGMAMMGDRRIDSNLMELFAMHKNHNNEYVGRTSRVVEFNVNGFQNKLGIEALINVRVLENSLQYLKKLEVIEHHDEYVVETRLSHYTMKGLVATLPKLNAVGIEFYVNDDLINEIDLF